ncbi:hypothetical protein [Sanguibacter sp. HDW7]|uniref:hypothetical protein n=1 Tax=Sanguibacter sp. HDW7 TaxID=2714931 RepID=UPI001407AC5F|nr:hypothetical protein [Sanguibacter sp. HDW7]QIK83010.1 hypothetical protein G7063_04745 [Sanguibacter sp. HDW7]
MNDTTATPAPLTADDLIDIEQLAAELAKRQDAIAADVDRIAEIKAILATRLPIGSLAVGDYKVIVKAGARRLSTSRLTAAFPVESYPALYKAALDTAAVKEQFAPAALAEYQDQGKPTVEVR